MALKFISDNELGGGNFRQQKSTRMGKKLPMFLIMEGFGMKNPDKKLS